MHIIQIANDEDKKRITRNILEELPEWFGRRIYPRQCGKNFLLC